MKIAITGHTSGLGKYLFTKLQDEHIVYGFSRSNNYALPEKFNEVAEQAIQCDIFINNAYVDDIQAKFIEYCSNKVSIITCGSMGADYTHWNKKYYSDKFLIESTHKRYKKNSKLPMLLLKMGYLENYPQYESISYEQILNGILFWMKNQRASIIEFDNVYWDNMFIKPKD